jgi:nucleotide-binding universal stress UspA family protein
MKILLAVDGSLHTKHMLAYVVANNEWFGAKHAYTVLHVVPFMPARVAAVTSQDAIQRYYAEETEKVLQPVRAFFKQQGLEADFIGRPGNAADVIAEQAQGGGCDLLLMGTHGHGNLGNLVLGPVATKVLASCKVPVLLVR